MAEAAVRRAWGGSTLRREQREKPGGEETFDLLRFALRFVLLALFSYVVATMLPVSLMEPVSRFTAKSAAALLQLFGMRTVVEGTTILAGSFRADVIPECTSLFMVALFSSFVLAAPAPNGKKAVGLLCGAALLTMLNLARIALVVVTGAHFPSLLDYVHVYLGQIAMIFSVFAVCMIWLAFATAASPLGSIPLFIIRCAAWSSLPFFIWLHLERWYVHFGDSLVRALFALFGWQLAIDYQQRIYYQTFNLVGFAALILASRSFTPSGKIKGLATGFLVLFITHLLIRVCNVLLFAFHMEAADKLSLVLSVTGDYLVPVIVWLAMACRNGASPLAERAESSAA